MESAAVELARGRRGAGRRGRKEDETNPMLIAVVEKVLESCREAGRKTLSIEPGLESTHGWLRGGGKWEEEERRRRDGFDLVQSDDDTLLLARHCETVKMDLRATVAAASLLDGILAAFDSPPSTANIQALSLACPPAMVLAALEMLDNGEGASSPPSLAGSTDEGT